MSICTDFAVFKVSKDNAPRAAELNLSIFNEMNANEAVIVAHEIL